MIARLLLTAFLLSLLPPLSAKTVAEMQQEGWQLTFDDEFDGTALDASKWNPHYNYDDIINHELQAYIPGAISVADGKLLITAKHEPGVQKGRTQAYTSGAMTTSKKFSQTYGWFEIRCKLPKGQGFWPAFWLLPDSNKWPPEIDIFENLGHENTKMHYTNHWRGPDNKPRGKGFEKSGPDFTADFHTIAIEWTAEAIIWYMDGVEQCRVTEHIPQENMYVLVNLAVGGDWPKSPDKTTVFPQALEVDYVRVYQRAAAAK